MPSIGPGNKPIAFGDFSYYWIIIRDEVSVKVLKELYYDDMQIGYIAREYLDAKLIRPEAIKVIQMN
jgi:HK97 family phage major capsid protein